MATIQSTRAVPSSQLRWLTLALAFAQVISPGLFALLSPTALDSSTNEALITPAGYAFSIWGLICLLSLAAAIALCRYEAPVRSPRRLHLDLATTFTGFNLWLLFAAYNWLWATVAVFATMAVALIDALIILAQSTSSTEPRWLHTLLRVTVGVYAGWTSIAVFVNFAAALVNQGVSINGTGGFVWQLLVVIAATIAAVALVRASRSSPSYAIAAEWALVAAAIGAYGRDADGLSMGAVTAVLVLGVTFGLMFRKQRQA